MVFGMLTGMTERTLILIKPDGVARGIVGEIIARIERKGLTLAALDLRVADRETAEKHYAEHADKPFFGDLVDFVTSAPLVAGIVEGDLPVSRTVGQGQHMEVILQEGRLEGGDRTTSGDLGALPGEAQVGFRTQRP